MPALLASPYHATSQNPQDCTPCRTASIASAIMASSPMADAATTSGSVVGCLRSTTLQLGPNRRMIRPKAITHSPQSTSPFVPNAAALCTGSQPCRAAPTLNHSDVTRHDRPAGANYNRDRPQCCWRCCPQRRHASHDVDHVAALAYRPSQGHRPTPLPRAALDRQRHLHANRRLCTIAKRARTSTANAPPALSP